MIKQEEWLDNLRTRVQNAEYVKAPQGLLDDVKGELARRGVAPAKAAEKSVLRTLWGAIGVTSAAAILAVGLYLSGVFTHKLPSSALTNTAKTERADVRVDNTNTTELSTGQPSVLDESLANLRSSASVPATHYVASRSGVAANTEKITKATSTDNIWEMEYKGNNDDADSPKPSAPAAVDAVPIIPKNNGVNEQSLLTLKTNRSSRFSIGASYIGGPVVSQSTKNLIFVSSDPYGEHKPEFSGENQKHEAVATDEVQTVSKHKQPVKVALSARYNLNDRWSLLSGLTYSWLSSEFTYQKRYETTTDKQTLHYVGIPLAVSYSFIKAKRLNVYVTAGGEAEKLVSGTTKQFVKFEERVETNNISVKEKEMQFSVNTAVGAEFKLSNNISIFAEPGVGYYFNNGSNVDNVYKKSPTRFNLNAGFRVNLNR